jgi:hypothetical protein
MLSDIERRLLRHYIDAQPIVNRRARSLQHLRLLAFGYIKEHATEIGNLVIIVTRAGYAALDDGPSAA